MTLTPGDFAAFFVAVHGYEPYPWQQRLVDHLAGLGDDVAATDSWPDVLDLPTGTGKTAALDIAVFHLALRADEPARAAVRIALVVDRRLVVDAAHERAMQIERALGSRSWKRPACPVVAEVARRLGRLAGPGEWPLRTHRLRGGAPLEDVWVRSPSQPTILCSTVDQVGSRLLFRGYGTSDRMKPIHAGLLGEGTLILLDEAHLSEPFRQTLKAVRNTGRAGTRAVLLTATPGVQAERVFRLDDQDRGHPDLARRIQSPKRARLVTVAGATPAKKFVKQACDLMKRLKASAPDPPAVGVVVNRVALARAVFELFRGEEDCSVVLMIGRARGVDRDAITARLRPFFSGAEQRATARPTFIIATQCLEVGVDLDLDGLVTQAAPLDALRQRFGRLNRVGRVSEAEGCVIALKADLAKRADDPIYGDRIRKTWMALLEVALESQVDFGSDALSASLGSDGDALSAPRSDAPVVMPAYMELWSQTSPIPACDPEVGLFLHGAERGSAEVSVVWRDDLVEADLLPDSPDRQDREMHIAGRLTAMPPRAAEILQLPIAAVRRWLADAADHRAKALDIGDAPQRSAARDLSLVSSAPRPVYRWAGQGHPNTGIVPPRQALRPGDLIVVPACYGGCDAFGWSPEASAPVQDVADRAAWPYRARRLAVRLHPSRFTGAKGVWRRVSGVLQRSQDVEGPDLLEHLVDVLHSESSEPDDASADADLELTRRSVRALRESRGSLQRVLYGSQPGDGLILLAARGVHGAARAEGLAPTTERGSFSQAYGEPVTLDDHGRHVKDLAIDFAKALGLDDAISFDLGLAAYLHDAGKADPRFQAFLSGTGNPWNAPDSADAVLAKSGCAPVRGAWKRAGLPNAWRHEALSVRIARSHPKLREAGDPALVLWLIGTHHGLGRPFFGFVETTRPRPLPALGLSGAEVDLDEPGPDHPAFDLGGLDWPSLAKSLRQRYGIWRLAFFEAVVRLADHRASEAEKEGGTG